MRCEWDVVPLRNLTGFISKGIVPSYTENETETAVRVLNQKCNRNFQISYEQSRLHDTSKKKVPAEKYIQQNDILINSTGTGTAGRVAQINDVPCKTTVDGHMIIVRANEKVTQRYLGYALKAHQQEILQLDEGSTGQTELNRERLLNEIMISFPSSVAKQEKIVALLSGLDKKIELNNKINENLERQATALFNNFYDQAETEISFTDVIQILGGGTPKTGESGYWGGKIPFFTPKDIGSPYTLNTEKTITEAGLARCNSRLYPINTVFVTARGTVGKVGMAGVPMAMNQSCYALVGKGIHQLLVYCYTLKVIDRLRHKASGAVFDAVTTKDFESEHIMRLPESIEKVFLCAAEPMYQAILSNSIENQKLAGLRDALLPKLISGEIDVSGI